MLGQGQPVAGVRPTSPANGQATAGAQSTALNATGSDEEIADDYATTTAEYHRFLIQESKWQQAEEARAAFMEGTQMRKERADVHRERGMDRQVAAMQQMKAAKSRVEECRERKLELAKVRRKRTNFLAPMVHNVAYHQHPADNRESTRYSHAHLCPSLGTAASA